MTSRLAQPIRTVLRALAPVSDEAISALAAVSVERQFAARHWLLTTGMLAEWCFLITSGLVRELYFEDSGAEHTRSFLREGQVTGSLLDLLSGQPAITSIQAIEPTYCIAWRLSDFDSLCTRFPELHVVARRHAEALCIVKTRREYEMLALSAGARYDRWLADCRDLDERVKQRELASYLGITPESLSRLRRQRRDRLRKPVPAGSAPR